MQKYFSQDVRVYVVNCDEEGDDFDFRELERAGDLEPIKEEARRQKSVYTLQEFMDACNDEDISTINSFILIE